MKRNKGLFSAVGCFLVAAFFGWGFAQDSIPCKVVKVYPGGNYLVQIKGQNFMAITEQQERDFLKVKRDLLDAQKELYLKDSLLAGYERARAWGDSVRSLQKEYISELTELSSGYKDLAKDYKKTKAPRVSVDIGLGASGDNTRPVIISAINVFRFKAWLLLQEKNTGGAVGATFPLF